VCAQYRQALGDEPHEIVGVHDANSLCEGYRRGLASSRGEIVVFSHDDIEIWSPAFAERLKGHLSQYDAIGIAGTSKMVAPGWITPGVPYVYGHVVHAVGDGTFSVELYGGTRRAVEGIKAMDGVFLAFRREVIERVGWDADTFTGFHLYDLDATYRAHLAGYRLAVALDITLAHYSGGKVDEVWRKYAEAFLKKHGATFERMSPRRFQWASVRVGSRADALQVIQDMQRQVT
jgi:GT2 family glycosyltransferase